MASVNTQFSIAVHVLSCLGLSDCKTSEELAQSVNANASFLRRLLSKLSKAGLINSARGKGGTCALAREPRAITLLDVYRAVEAPKAFAVHQYPERKSCFISKNIKATLGGFLDETQSLIEQNLKQTTLADVVNSLKKKR